jgi:hypothetical protein
MNTQISIKQISANTEKYLRKNPISSNYDLPSAVRDEYVMNITRACAHGNVDEVHAIVRDVYRLGFSKGLKQAKNGCSMVAGSSISPDEVKRYAEVAAMLSSEDKNYVGVIVDDIIAENKGGADDGKN